MEDALIGETLGPYLVEAELGRGGMGAVYRAHDDALDRPVALKFLAPHLVTSETLVQRFEQEARSTSALNHPNIVTVYEIRNEGGRRFLVTELIEGQTLRELMEEERLDTDRALDVARQTAEALGAAHEKGILHRDIKPDNIMVRDDGLVKVLDFGLAKLLRGDSAPENETLAYMTEPGTVPGTISYMSPEQARGEPLDPRSDLFSLGVVLYELLSGIQPFRRDSKAQTYTALLTEQAPALDSVLEQSHPAASWVLDRALQKDRSLRFQSSSDFRAALDHLQRSSDVYTAPEISVPVPTEPATATRKADSTPLLASGLLAAGIVAAVAAWRLLGPAPVTANDPTSYVKLTAAAGTERDPSLSPEGRFITYSVRDGGDWDVFTQRVPDGQAINLTADSDADDRQPDFSPSGNQIVFRSERDGGGLFVMGATGEDLRRLTRGGFHPTWSPSGDRIAYSTQTFYSPQERGLNSDLEIVDLESGEVNALNLRDAIEPAWSPRGDRIAYWGMAQGSQRDIWTVDVATGEARTLTDSPSIDWSPQWSADGRHVLFLSDRNGSMNLWQLQVGPDGSAQRAPMPRTLPASDVGALSGLTANGELVFGHRASEVALVGFDLASDLSVEATRWVSRGSRQVLNPELSPDGTKILYGSIGARNEDLYVLDLASGRSRQLTRDPAKDRAGMWSPDGRQIAFFSDRSGRYEMFVIAADGSDLRRLTDSAETGVQAPVWSPDGSRLVINRQKGLAASILDLTSGKETPLRIPDFGTDEPLVWRWSPDGLRMTAQGGGKVVAFDIASGGIVLGPVTGSRPVWLADSRTMAFARGTQLFLLEAGAEPRELLRTDGDEVHSFALALSGRRIYASVLHEESDLWL
ncbi:MAG: protein kinase, partial [Acidobacteriota bacterium]